MNNILKLLGVLISLYFASILFAYVNNRIEHDPQNIETISFSERMRQLDCLSQNVYYEASGENAEGKAAVAIVTLNRTKSSKFPSDVCAVVYQKNKIACQFSWYCDKPKALAVRNPKVYKECEDIAKAVLLEGFTLPSLKNAEYYHADWIPQPSWAKKMKQVAQIGKHKFYTEVSS